MNFGRRRAWMSWAGVAFLSLLCAVLAILQNGWLDEVSRGERERLRHQLHEELEAVSRELNESLGNAASAIVPDPSEVHALGLERACALRFAHWQKNHPRYFQKVALAIPQHDAIELLVLNPSQNRFVQEDWPADWSQAKLSLEGRLHGEFNPFLWEAPYLVVIPRFDPSAQPNSSFHRPVFHEQSWLILDLDRTYILQSMLPALLARHLTAGGKLQYQVQVASKLQPEEVIYRSDSKANLRPDDADGMVNLLEVHLPEPNRRENAQASAPPPHGGGPARGRWHLLVRYEGGALDELVARARWQNAGLSAGILLLILITGFVLVQSSRRAQHLADLQMAFVAGVSHALRTPLTVIRTAAFNLRGRMSERPEQVMRYGKMIEDQSVQLTALVDQVLRFASARAGHAIRNRQAVSIDSLVEQSIRSNAAISNAGLTVETTIEPELPLVFADADAIQHVISNLLDNAFKYGTVASKWIGITVRSADEPGLVEIRVSDRGPGIPENERKHIFEPFFRGRRAIDDQIYGTGLGLNLVKSIVEAHGGTVTVESKVDRGVEFCVRLPAAPFDEENVYAHTSG